MFSYRSFVILAFAVLSATSAVAASNAATPSAGTRYATDAYPGFDREEEIVSSGQKDPRWFSWVNGPSKDNAADQMAYAQACQKEGSWRAARRAYDALVREWPASPEAPRAQEALAEMYLEHYQEYENAFREYKYLLDFYSTQCDFDATAFRLYEIAKLMREEGKTLMFFRFANTVDVRRAFEAVVLRAPGARFAPAAMMTIAQLREDDGEYQKAIQVYENIRNLHAREPEAKAALHREGRARMLVLREHAYNRARCQDTIAFMKMALAMGPDAVARADYESWLNEAVGLIEDEAFRAAKFYDSRTRTKRSAISAYERFLSTYPASVHAEEARARLEELQQEGK